MARKLSNVGVILALVLGCWGGLLAAAVCPHEACRTKASASVVNDAAHDGRASGHAHEAAAHEDHSLHVQTHEGHAAERPAQAHNQGSAGRPQSVARVTHDSFCAHCVGRNEAPPSSCFERRAHSARKGGESAAPAAAAAPITAHAALYVREITPAQHAPPGGRSDRHLLLNVFRI